MAKVTQQNAELTQENADLSLKSAEYIRKSTELIQKNAKFGEHIVELTRLLQESIANLFQEEQ